MLLLIYIGIKKFLFISYYNEHSQKGYTSFQKWNTIW
jgi:hypothetical protein